MEITNRHTGKKGENVRRAEAGGGKGGIGHKLSQDSSQTCNLYFLLLSIAYVR